MKTVIPFFIVYWTLMTSMMASNHGWRDRVAPGKWLLTQKAANKIPKIKLINYSKCMAFLVDFNNRCPGQVAFENTHSKNVKIPTPACPFPGRTLICVFICLPTQTLLLNFTLPPPSLELRTTTTCSHNSAS